MKIRQIGVGRAENVLKMSYLTWNNPCLMLCWQKKGKRCFYLLSCTLTPFWEAHKPPKCFIQVKNFPHHCHFLSVHPPNNILNQHKSHLCSSFYQTASSSLFPNHHLHGNPVNRRHPSGGWGVFRLVRKQRWAALLRDPTQQWPECQLLSTCSGQCKKQPTSRTPTTTTKKNRLPHRWEGVWNRERRRTCLCPAVR